MAQEKMKVYCETSFWSWLVSRPSTNPDHAVKQAWTRKWWEEIAPKCDVYVSEYVSAEAGKGNAEMAERRMKCLGQAFELNAMIAEVENLAERLKEGHAIPECETTDALHIAVSAVYGMDVLLTWNCRHMANPVTLPKTSAIIAKSGYVCPVIITPFEFLERKEEFSL